MKLLRITLLSSLLVTSCIVLADTTQNTTADISSKINSQNNTVATHTEYLSTQITQSVFEKLSPEQQQIVASMWGLSTTDYPHYLWLMSNTPNSIYYSDKSLDPAWILGMNASNERELQKYVVIALKNELAVYRKS